MKFLSLLIFQISLTIFSGKAQPIPVNPAPPPSSTRPSVPKVLVTFITDDTCNMSINGKSYNIFPKTKTVELPVGTHKLFFESLETGKTIRDRGFLVTKEMLLSGKYEYVIKLKE